MGSSLGGSIPLFRVAGIQVYLHWLWFLVAFYEIQKRADRYGTLAWNVAEYLALFGIVLLHEFGHALACRQVGGSANEIVLWPLGGIAFVNPPPRPGAWLWSIAAGPLVNVVLLPVTIGLYIASQAAGWEQTLPDLNRFLEAIAVINGLLLVFNLLPIYPLDGGQILQSLLWFFIGRAQSLMVVSVLGMVGGVGLVGLAIFFSQSTWLIVLAIFIGFRCVTGFQQAQALSKMLRAPRHKGLACPSCGEPPLAGTFWSCPRCHNRFDIFADGAVCPYCQQAFAKTQCMECGRSHPLDDWYPQVLPAEDPSRERLA